MSTYHAVLACSGLKDAEARFAPALIEEEFFGRPWHQNLLARWDGTAPWLEADNDYEENGLVLLDELAMSLLHA
jgi:hypothetical protein